MKYTLLVVLLCVACSTAPKQTLTQYDDKGLPTNCKERCSVEGYEWVGVVRTKSGKFICACMDTKALFDRINKELQDRKNQQEPKSDEGEVDSDFI